MIPAVAAVLGPPLDLFGLLADKALGQDIPRKFKPTRVEETLGWTEPPPGEAPGFLPIEERGLRGLNPFEGEYRFGAWWPKMKLESLFARAGEPGVEIVRLLEFPYRRSPLAVELEIDPARMPAKPDSSARAASRDAQVAAYAAERRWGADAVGTLRHVTFKNFPKRGEDVLLVRGETTVFRREAAWFRRCLDAADLWHERSEDPEYGLDGTHWVVEVLCDGRYHAMQRWMPRRRHIVDGREGFVAVADWLLARAVGRRPWCPVFLDPPLPCP